jgi:hypothetical protein
MVEIIKILFEEIIVCIALGGGGLLVGFFRKLSKTQSDLCSKVTTLQQALLLLSTALDNQTKRIHGEQVGEVDLSELVRSLINRKE